MGTSRTCLLFITIQLIYATSAQDFDKRVPQGFVGMRGKKYNEPTEQFYKRRPQFFVGVKGKKSIFDLLQSSEEKRVPMGFVGMRGKKDPLYYPDYLPQVYSPKRDGSLIGQIDYTESDEWRNEKFPIFKDFLLKYLSSVEEPSSSEATVEATTAYPSPDYDMTNEVQKRAANLHQFYGVRGKKFVENKRPYDLTFRGKFIGVRGKKDLKNSGMQEIRFLLPNGPWPKRKAQMGFVGMRGKKWFNDSSPESETYN